MAITITAALAEFYFEVAERLPKKEHYTAQDVALAYKLEIKARTLDFALTACQPYMTDTQWDEACQWQTDTELHISRVFGYISSNIPGWDWIQDGIPQEMKN